MEQDLDRAVLLLPNLPPFALCGLDLVSFKTSPRFQGIKNIPKGWHFVFSGINDAVSIRHGSWFHVSGISAAPPELFIRKYDAENEELVAQSDEQTISNSRAGLGSIWREGLTPYRTSAPNQASESEEDAVEENQDWDQLTDCINAALLSRITGDPETDKYWSLTSAGSAKQDADNIPGLSREESALHHEKVLGFLPIDLKKTWREGAIGRERTEAAQDRSWALRSLIDSHCQSPFDVIGEIQFTFIAVLTLNNNSCLEQWKRLLSLLLTCKTAIVDHADFFVHFLSTLRLQLQHSQDAEGGLFDLSEDGAPFLKSLLKRFRRGLEQQTGHGKGDVMDELEDLEDFLKLEYDWMMNEPHVKSGWLRLEDGEEIDMDLSGIDEEDESGDYAPTIVGLSAEQAKALDIEGDSVEVRRKGRSALERDVAKSFEEDSGSEDEQLEEDNEDEEEQDLEDMDARY